MITKKIRFEIEIQINEIKAEIVTEDEKPMLITEVKKTSASETPAPVPK